jgi:hypothetical protein
MKIERIILLWLDECLVLSTQCPESHTEREREREGERERERERERGGRVKL